MAPMRSAPTKGISRTATRCERAKTVPRPRPQASDEGGRIGRQDLVVDNQGHGDVEGYAFKVLPWIE